MSEFFYSTADGQQKQIKELAGTTTRGKKIEYASVLKLDEKSKQSLENQIRNVINDLEAEGIFVEDKEIYMKILVEVIFGDAIENGITEGVKKDLKESIKILNRRFLVK